MRVTSLRTRIALVFLALMLGVQLAGFVVIRASIDRNARAAVDTQLEVGARVFERLYTQNADTLMQAARILAADYGFREAVGSDDRETIDSALANHGARIGASLSMFWSVEPAPRASSGAALAPDALEWLTTVVRGAAQRDGAHGAVLLDGHLHQVVAVPVRAPLPIGWVVLGFSSDQGLATDLRALSTLHVSFLAADDARRPPQVLSSTLPDGEAALLRDHAAEALEQAQGLRGVLLKPRVNRQTGGALRGPAHALLGVERQYRSDHQQARRYRPGLLRQHRRPSDRGARRDRGLHRQPAGRCTGSHRRRPAPDRGGLFLPLPEPRADGADERDGGLDAHALRRLVPDAKWRGGAGRDRHRRRPATEPMRRASRGSRRRLRPAHHA
jgi:hypothetical protein